MNIVDAVVQGILLGGLYALFATGLSLIFGVMRLVNIAHGDFIVLGAYVALIVTQTLGLHPFLSLIIVVPVMAGIGYLIQKALLNRTLGENILPPILITFGLAIIIQNTLLTFFSTDAQRLSAGPIEVASIEVGGLNLGVLPLLTFGVAVALIAALEWLSFRTRLGRAFRATSDDPEMARSIGVSTRHVFALAMALCFAVIAVAGVLLAARSNFDPFSGPARLIYGFEAVIIGGLGNLWGTLAGGVVLGVAQTLGAQISPSFQILAGHIVFFIVLAIRPRGLFPRMD
ncbi:branched-chain amino acid ABC transporter permease [Pseudooceanicola sp. MF1-13]|uniref:branched-chain amino acid ABC transporter permease n=1 Tax=Pseudooceanicola sp. MF1-13 TaxID=3379095 RepID=UPI00389226C5